MRRKPVKLVGYSRDAACLGYYKDSDDTSQSPKPVPIKVCLDFQTAVRNNLQKTQLPKDPEEICRKYSTIWCGEQWEKTLSPQNLPTFEYKKIEWRTEERWSWRVTMESMEQGCAQTIEGEFQVPQKWTAYAGGQWDFAFSDGTGEMNTRRLHQILCSALHTGSCLTVSKDCRIYPGARCLTGTESDLALFDCQQKMTSDLFLFLLIHRNSYEQFPMVGYKQKTF